MKKIFLSLFFASILSGQLFAQEVNTAKLDSFFNALDKGNRAMGSFAISKNGKVIYQKSIGYSLLDEKKKIAASDVSQYRIGSITKVFTAALIFQLIDQGKLTLDTKLSSYFPQLPNAQNITIGHLLGHTSGLADYVSDAKDQLWITIPRTRNELLEVVIKGKTHFEPGQGVLYCNSGYLLLTYILEDLTREPYAKLVEKRIFAKIGLKHTFSSKANNSEVLEARTYVVDAPWKQGTDIYFPNVIGVGDMLSTPKDLLTFINALSEGKLVSAKSFNLMKTFKPQAYTGMGLFGAPFGEKIGISHNGGTYGSYSALVKMEADDVSFAICMNAANYSLNDVTIAVLSDYYHIPYQIPVLVTAEDLDPYLGSYSCPQHPMKLTFTRKGNTLIVQATGQQAFPVVSMDKNRFELKQVGLSLEFKKEKQQLILKQGGGTYLFEKEKS